MPATITGLYVRHVTDADKLFHAVKLGMLPLIRRRLDAEDRAALKPGCVYVWEESKDGVNFDGIKRFTDGITWDPSRTRDGFLVYLERKKIPGMKKLPVGARVRTNGPLSALDSPGSGAGDIMIKKTYSVFVIINGTRRNWHLNAYYTENAIRSLQTVDDLPPLRDLVVPAGLYRWAKAESAPNDESDIYNANMTAGGVPNAAVFTSPLRAPEGYMSPLSTAPTAPSPRFTDTSGSSPYSPPRTPSTPNLPRPSSSGRVSRQQQPAYFQPAEVFSSASRPPSRGPQHPSAHYGTPDHNSFGTRSEYAPSMQFNQTFHPSSGYRAATPHNYPIPSAQLGRATPLSPNPRPHSTSPTAYHPSGARAGLQSGGVPPIPSTALYQRSRTPAGNNSRHASLPSWAGSPPLPLPTNPNANFRPRDPRDEEMLQRLNASSRYEPSPGR